MGTRIFFLLGLAFSAHIQGQCPVVTQSDVAAGASGWKEALAEIQRLRLDLLEWRIDAQAQKVTPLEQALAQVRAERIRLREQEQANAAQLAQVDARLAGAGIGPEERAQFDAIRATLTGPQLDQIRAGQTELDKLEAEAADRLRVEQQRLQELQARRAAAAAGR